jgi:large-conductance mechanosensitive channel
MVDDILMPPIGMVAGNLDFSNMYISLSPKVDEQNAYRKEQREAERIAAAATQPTSQESALDSVAKVFDTSDRLTLDDARKFGPVIAYGKFITNLINLFIVAFCVFLLVKAVNTARKRMEKEKQTAAPPAPPDVVLLGEIRDILKQKQA